ncbi:MAG: hypothetical protein L3J82_01595 [Planctomycetes bacterium]|nr:hypothetical protein [Planctomycetota bacterium]
MAFWNKILKKKETDPVAVEDAPVDTATAESLPENESERDGAKGGEKKSLLKRFESNVRRKVDSYVNEKTDGILDEATERAEQFRQETIDEVHNTAMDLLDITEQRIDQKLKDIEVILEERIRAELKMRLRALVWTLVFVLLMALISVGYVWFKKSTGLHESNSKPATDSSESNK